MNVLYLIISLSLFQFYVNVSVNTSAALYFTNSKISWLKPQLIFANTSVVKVTFDAELRLPVDNLCLFTEVIVWVRWWCFLHNKK
jgi:hypothetical protein